MRKNLFTQKGFSTFLTTDQAKNSFAGLFNWSRWLKEELNYLGVKFFDPCCPDNSTVETSQTLAAAGAIDTSSYLTKLTSTAPYAATLADGYEGQDKMIYFRTDGGDVTVTPAHLSGGTTLTFNDAGDYVRMVFVAGLWIVTTNNGVTIA